MNTELTTARESTLFKHPSFGSVRVVMLGDGDPWFVAKDVCDCLELTDTSKTVSLLDDDEKGTNTIRTLGGPQNFSIISESGLYSLVLRSRKPEAKGFKRWITHDVLPSIRKTGQYGLPNFADPVAAAEAWIERYKSEQAALAENKRLALENAEQARTITKQADTIDDLEVALGDNRDWKAVTAIPWLKDYFINTGTYVLSRVGKVLARMSRQAAVEIRKAPDKRWNTVNVYHVTIIARFHRMLDDDPTLLADIRK